MRPQLGSHEDGHAADAAQSYLERLRPGEAGPKVVTIKEGRDSASSEQLLNGSHGLRVGAVVAEENIRRTHGR